MAFLTKKRLLLLAVPLFCCAFLWASPDVQDLPLLKEADIVFHTSNTSQATAIMLSSHSLYSHMGMITIGKDGKPYVVETSSGGRATPLDKWIERGRLGRITIKRVRDLSPAKAHAVIIWAKRHYAKPYDFFFLEDNKAFYCSELVYDAYAAAGISIGRFQKLSSLSMDNAPARRLVEKRWKKHPVCAARKAENFEACYQIILDGSLVTPVSMAEDEKLETVYSNYLF